MRTIGFGISLSAGYGLEVSVQRGLVRDGASGNWYYVETSYQGVGGSGAPIAVSFDHMKFNEGVSMGDISGDGFFVHLDYGFSANFLYNGAGDIIGKQISLISDIGGGGGITQTTVIPFDQIGDEIRLPLQAAFLAGMYGLALGGPLAGAAGFIIAGMLASPLSNFVGDPLILDLDGDGIELSPLEDSTIHFDYGQDGFAELTGWVKPDDGILVADFNANGTADGAGELFGSPTQDGFAVLETYDTNGDGKITAADTVFSKLHVWQDIDQDGATDPGEMTTLVAAGITSISLTRDDVSGANAGHPVGFEALFTRADGTTGSAQTIYFETDTQNSRADNTPEFTVAEGVLQLPQLPGSGLINSIAWKATEDAAFRADWTALTDSAASLSREELQAKFEDLVLRWAGVEGVADGSRGQYVDARHLAFVEKFFGSTYQELVLHNWSTSPSRAVFGNRIEASFDQIVDVMLTAFLSQTTASGVARDGELTAALASPYFFLSLLDFRDEFPAGTAPPETPGNIGMVMDFILAMMPEETGAAATYLSKALSALDGMVTIAFDGDRDAYVAATSAAVTSITDSDLRQIAAEIIEGTAALGTAEADGMSIGPGNNVFSGGASTDLLISAAGNDLYVYQRGDGSDYIRDASTSIAEVDTLLLADLGASDLSFERLGTDLIIKISGTTDQITAEDFFADWGLKNRGIDRIRLADGTVLDRETIRSQTVTVGTSGNNVIWDDETKDDVLRGGKGSDQIIIRGGNDTILWGAGDGLDVIDDKSGVKAEIDKLVLAGLNPEDVRLTRSGDALLVEVIATDEIITDKWFFYGSANPDAASGWNNHGWGIDRIEFGNGMAWDRQAIVNESWIRGNNWSNGLVGSGLGEKAIGAGGNDSFVGKAGSDTFYWKTGDGSDQIDDADTTATSFDKLVLTDVRPEGVRLSRSGDSLLITILATDEVISIANQFDHLTLLTEEVSEGAAGIETIQFANGATWDRELIAKAVGEKSLGKEFNEILLHIQGVIQEHYFEDEFGNRGDIYSMSANLPGATSFDGHDIFVGSDGNDTIKQYGEENDPFTVIYFVDNPVTIRLHGQNYLRGYQGDDVLLGMAGDDVLEGDQGNDTLDGGRDHDALDGGDGNDALFGGAGNDALEGRAGTDTLNGGDGSDYLRDWSAEDDVFEGGKGDDVILSAGVRGLGNSGSNTGNDTFIYRLGDGNDLIFDGSHSQTEIDRLVLVDIDSDEVRLWLDGNNLLITVLATGETIVDEGFLWAWSSAGQGLDRIEFADGVVWDRAQIRTNAEAGALIGTSGRDSLSDSSPWDQIFDGRQGDDVLTSGYRQGGNGNDTFLYRRGDGNDLILDESRSTTEVDRLILVDINDDEVELSRVGTTLFIKDIVSGQTITNQYFLENAPTHSRGIERIEFANGVVWDRAKIIEEAWYRGSPTSERIHERTIFDDTYFGGLGDDLIITVSSYEHAFLNHGVESGSDTFVYRLGDGNDRIYDDSTAISTEIDTLVLQGIDVDDVSLLAIDGNVQIEIVPTGHKVTDAAFSFDTSTVGGSGLDRIRFADGTIWDRGDIRYWSQEGSIFHAGGTAAETFIGSHFDQRLSGGGGNDFIDGKEGVDLLFGDNGNDTLAISVDDVGAVDALDGGTGTDTATFADFASAISVDLVANEGQARTNGTISLDGGDLRLVATLRAIENVIGTSNADAIAGDAADNNLEGADGNDRLEGRSGDDILVGGAGNDVLDGALGDDRYHYFLGDGNDTIFETAIEGGTADQLRLYGIEPAEVALSRADGKLVVTIGTAALTIVGSQSGDFHYDQYGIELIQFDDGVAWDKNYLRQMSISDSATDGNDTLTGTAASGVMRGKRGDDALNGGSGDDTYLYARGDGNDVVTEANASGSNDRINFTDINQADITASRNGNDLLLTIRETSAGAGDGGSIVIKATLGSSTTQGIEAIEFADGTVLDRAAMLTLTSGISGTAGDDTINGTSAADDIMAGLGNDRLIGVAGGDSYIYQLGDGNDSIEELTTGTDIDRLVLVDINQTDIRFERPFNAQNDVVVRVLSTGHTITLKTQLDQEGGVEKIVFADGTVLGADDWSIDTLLKSVTIYGTAGDDTISTSASSDDTVDPGAGNDAIGGEYGNDKYLFGLGYGNDRLDERMTGTDVDTLKLLGLNQSDIRFERSFADLTDLIVRINATGETFTLDNQFDQEDGVEKIVFADGTILGGNDWSLDGMLLGLVTIYGTSGNDTIYGSTTSNDILDGGGGNDYLAGEEGSDTYIYRAGDGNDLVNEKMTGTDKDTLKLLGLNLADIEIERLAADLTDVTVRIKSTGETFTLDNQFDQEDGVEKILFADGTILGGDDWSLDGLLGNLAHLAGGAGDDTITGYASKNDTIIGKSGNDTLKGLSGSDTFVFGPGFGDDIVLDFIAGAATDDILQFDSSVFANITAVLAAASQNGADTVITYDANNKVTLKNVVLSNFHADDFAFV